MNEEERVNGRSFKLEDDKLIIGLSREDYLDIASQVYADYFLSEQDKKMSFGDYLSNELRKVRERKNNKRVWR